MGSWKMCLVSKWAIFHWTMITGGRVTSIISWWWIVCWHGHPSMIHHLGWNLPFSSNQIPRAKNAFFLRGDCFYLCYSHFELANYAFYKFPREFLMNIPYKSSTCFYLFGPKIYETLYEGDDLMNLNMTCWMPSWEDEALGCCHADLPGQIEIQLVSGFIMFYPIHLQGASTSNGFI